MSSSLRYNIIANFSGKAWAGVFNLVFAPLYIKLLGIEVYGLLGVFISLSAMLALLDMGLSATLSRELSRLSAFREAAHESRSLLRTFEVVYWGTGILIGIAVVLSAGLLAEYWINPNGVDKQLLKQALMIMGFSIAIQWPTALYAGGLTGLQQQVVLNVIRSVMVAIQHVGSALLLVFVWPSIQLFFIWQSITGFLTTIVLGAWLWKSLRHNRRPAFGMDILKKHWRFATGLTGISLFSIVLTQLDKVILSKMLTLEMFGYYMLAFSVANALQSLVSPISSALFPKFSQLVALGERAKLARLYHQGCQLLAVFVLPAAATIALFSKEILTMWLGNSQTTENAHQILTLLMIGTALNALMTLPFTLQLAYGWTKLSLYKNIAAVILLVPLMVLMVKTYQGIGAASVWIILNLGYVIFEVPIMHQRLLVNEMGTWYRRDIAIPLLIVTIIGLSARAVMPVDAPKPVVLSGLVMCLGLSFAASYLSASNLTLRKVDALL